MTGGEGGSHEKVTEGDRGEGGGVSGPPKKGDVIYERPLRDGIVIVTQFLTLLGLVGGLLPPKGWGMTDW